MISGEYHFEYSILLDYYSSRPCQEGTLYKIGTGFEGVFFVGKPLNLVVIFRQIQYQ